MRKWIRLATLALPTERVGVGARWQYAFSAMTEVQPTAMPQHRMDFELLSLTPKISVRLLKSEGQAQVYDRGRLIEVSETGSIALTPRAKHP